MWKIVEKFQETGNPLDRPGHWRKRSGVSSPQLLKNTREKLRRNPPRSCRTLATAAGVSKSIMHQMLKNDLVVKLLKMLHPRGLRPIMWAWELKNAGKFSKRWPTARCLTSCLRTRKNSASGRWYISKMTEFRLLRHIQRKGSSPDAKICTLSWFARPSQRPGVPSNLCAFWSQIELSGCLLPWDKKHFQGGLVPATGRCALSRFQDHPVLDSEENPFIHKQGNLACKEPWP